VLLYILNKLLYKIFKKFSPYLKEKNSSSLQEMTAKLCREIITVSFEKKKMNAFDFRMSVHR